MADEFDLVVRGGTIADGTGGAVFAGDVGIKDGLIAAVGQGLAPGKEEIDARGLLVTPGFVDVHTHYDGQLTWSETLTPSSNHGVTTVVIGNCGVGFAPCRTEDRDGLIRLMEGVEDIPEVVMAEGLPWNWNSFPEFLDAVERRPHDIDFAALFPHAPLRVFTMGQRALDLEAATPDDLATMRRLTREAMEAGAVGFATSRNIFHQASDGSPVPTLSADEKELTEIARGLEDAGRGLLQGITVTAEQSPEDYILFHRVGRAVGRPVTYTLLPIERHPNLWRDVATAIEAENASGGDVTAQVFNRPVGVILGLETNLHALATRAYYRENIAHLPLEGRVAEMRRPEVRKILLEQDAGTAHALANNALTRFNRMYPMGEVADYEPDPATSVAAVAAARGVGPLDVLYDMLLEQEGRAKLLVAATGYGDENLDEIFEMMQRDDMVLGLGDGGAHYGMICDASYTTYTLSHWVRDRQKGERLGLAQAVHKLTQAPARLYRFKDRGEIAVGKKGDLNVIDLDRLTLHSPKVIHDLPAGGRRLSQDADGYVATVVAGSVIRRNGQDTGARPGKLVRNAGI